MSKEPIQNKECKKKAHRHKWESDGDSCHNCGSYVAICYRCEKVGYFDDKGKLEYEE